MSQCAYLCLAAALSAGCSDGTFVVSNVDDAPVEAGAHDVDDASARVVEGLVRLEVDVGDEPDPCRFFLLAFCEADGDRDLAVTDAIPDQGQCGAGRERGAVTARFVDRCGSHAEWTAVRGEGRAEVDGDDVRLVFHAELAPVGFSSGTFEVDVDVEAGPPPLGEGRGSPPWDVQPLAAAPN